MPELKPCPFCSSTDVDITETGECQDYYTVLCDSCGAEGPIEAKTGDLKKAEDRARSRWNTRAEEKTDA